MAPFSLFLKDAKSIPKFEEVFVSHCKSSFYKSRATLPKEIKIGETVQWNINYLQMGVGGDSSWGRLVHPEYTIPADKVYNYSFSIIPFH